MRHYGQDPAAALLRFALARLRRLVVKAPQIFEVSGPKHSPPQTERSGYVFQANSIDYHSRDKERDLLGPCCLFQGMFSRSRRPGSCHQFPLIGPYPAQLPLLQCPHCHGEIRSAWSHTSSLKRRPFDYSGLASTIDLHSLLSTPTAAAVSSLPFGKMEIAEMCTFQALALGF
jgi:hypothetical protein